MSVQEVLPEWIPRGMWCDRCQSDVKTDATASATTLRCQQCGAVVAENPHQSDAVRQARAILDRWKSSDLLDRISATESLPPLVWSTSGRVTSPNSKSATATEPPVPTAAESPKHDDQSATDYASHTDELTSQTAPQPPVPGSVQPEIHKPIKANSIVPQASHAGPTDVAEPKPATEQTQDAEKTPDTKLDPSKYADLHSSSPIGVQSSSNVDLGRNSGNTDNGLARDAETKAEFPIASSPESPLKQPNDLHTHQDADAETADSNQITKQKSPDESDASTSERASVGQHDEIRPAPWLTTTVDLSVGDDFDKPVNYISASENVITRLTPRRSADAQQPKLKTEIESDDTVYTGDEDTVFNAGGAACSAGSAANTEAGTGQPQPESRQPFDRSKDLSTLEPNADQPFQLARNTEPDSAEQSAAIVAHDESVPDRAETAETHVPVELAPFTTPKKHIRQPSRRPPVKRRSGSARNPTSSTGPVTVNRKFRVDQPGGKDNDDLQSLQASSPSDSSVQSAPVASSTAPETKLVSNAGPASASRRFRFDTAESVNDLAETDGSRTRTHNRPKRRYIDEPHGSAPRGPHFEISPPKRSNLTSMTGQFLAYLGVLGLTIGTAIVIYGHFGGYSEYTPTGWLVTTVAQMLLFLGVINLVSGGIEQNNEEVSRRINTLGEQLLRIESVTEEVLRGPKISPRRYMDPDSADTRTTQRETADIE